MFQLASDVVLKVLVQTGSIVCTPFLVWSSVTISSKVWSDPGRLKVENHSPIVEIDVLAVRGG